MQKQMDAKRSLKVFTPNYYEKRINNLSDKEIVNLLSKVRNGLNLATPVFDGARDVDIKKILETAGLDNSGQVTLIDGRTGETFNRKVTVGYIYMLKLHHLVDDKFIHVPLVLTVWSLNNLWEERLNLEDSALAKWKFGLYRLMGHLILFKKCLL